jgi:hypothetical protein
MKGDIGRSMACRSSVMAGGAEAAQQLHDVVIVLWRRPAAAQDPVEQIGVRAIEQSLEPVELPAVEVREGRFGERAEDEVVLLRPAMPAAEQQAPAADILMR